MYEKITQAVNVLNNSGVLARNGEEAKVLELFRQLPDCVKEKQVARMDGFLEAYSIKEKMVK